MERRTTVQKELVLRAVRELGNHATAEEIYEHVSSEYPSVSKATVYRNLNVLSEEGLICRVEIPGEADHFDHVCDSHYHILCVKCGRVFDVDMDVIPDLTERIRNSGGFQILSGEVIFRGICPECGKES